MKIVEGNLKEHISKVEVHRTEMTTLKKERMEDIECAKDARRFPVMTNGEQTKTDTEDETFKCILKTINGKKKVIEYLTGKIDRYKMRLQNFMEKIEKLDQETVTKDNQLDEQNKKIEDQYPQFKRKKTTRVPKIQMA